jgi:hypothetical protein
MGAEESRAQTRRLKRPPPPRQAAAIALAAGLACVWLSAAPAASAPRRQDDLLRRPVATLRRNPIIADVIEQYRTTPIQLYLVALIVFVVGLLLHVPPLIAVLGAGAFLVFPLVKGVETEDVIRWGGIGAVAFLMLHYFFTTPRGRP